MVLKKVIQNIKEKSVIELEKENFLPDKIN